MLKFIPSSQSLQLKKNFFDNSHVRTLLALGVDLRNDNAPQDELTTFHIAAMIGGILFK